MTYPYPELLPLLQLKCTPAQYQRVIARFTREDGLWVKDELLADPEYQSLLPSLTYAHCPICGYTLEGLVDVYQFEKGVTYPELNQMLYPFGYNVISFNPAVHYTVPADYPHSINVNAVFDGTQKFAHCKHFLGVHNFVNYHGSLPYPHGACHGEVPWLNTWMVDFNTPGFAVIFAFPICKIENDAFVPAYTIFSLSYFSPDRDGLLEEWQVSQRQIMDRDPEYYPSLVTVLLTSRRGKAPHDLVEYAKEGKLGYLDINQSDSPLQIGLGTVLPKMYWHIEGRSYFEW